MKSVLYFFISLLLLSLFNLPLGFAGSNRVERSERLQLLNQATGESSSSQSTFQNRLDAILNTTQTAERNYVQTEEFEAKEERNALALEEAAAEEKRLKELNPDRYDPKKNSDQTQIADSSLAEEFKYDGSQKAYEEAQKKIQKEFDERIAPKPDSQAAAAKGTGSAAASSLPPSLANNPFYTQQSAEAEESEYEAMKPLIISRILMRNDVFTRDQVEDYVRRASSKEELIMILMKEPFLSYGDASESVG